jgi:arsenite/tail-anchored protein-transporting ATPase
MVAANDPFQLEVRVDIRSINARYVFFTGKGGVGKTSIACATAISLADSGSRVLLVSTDPASNLDEVLEVGLRSTPVPVPGTRGLEAMNLDPEVAAAEYREKMVGPYRGVLPDATVRSMEEQLSGSCTMEIAAFDEFSRLLGDPDKTATYDHVLFDTAPTGHTLRLLSLPQAWSAFLETNSSGTSCLGPLAGLKAQQALYEASMRALSDPAATLLVLVSRPETSALREAERSSGELRELGVTNQRLVLNGVFKAAGGADAIAVAFERRGREATVTMPSGLAGLPREEVALSPQVLLGVGALRTMFDSGAQRVPEARLPIGQLPPPLVTLVDELERRGRGVVMTMGKGGVGKTTVAAAVAMELARRGHKVHLSTTDPAAHVDWVIENPPPGLRVGRIDAEGETRTYRDEVMSTVGEKLDDQGRALLAEDLRSPCTEEVAVFRTFARTVAEGQDGFVVLDTAPTGHTILLLDAAEAYHREVLRQSSNMPETVRDLLPRLRDSQFTSILLVTLPEATPVHEAGRLQSDLARAGITPFAWVINQALSPLTLQDPLLQSRQANEQVYIREVTEHLASRSALIAWLAGPPTGDAGLSAASGGEGRAAARR